MVKIGFSLDKAPHRVIIISALSQSKLKNYGDDLRPGSYFFGNQGKNELVF
jgi:hypothetical protein